MRSVELTKLAALHIGVRARQDHTYRQMLLHKHIDTSTHLQLSTDYCS
jgi:hypothetical protein